MISAAHKQLWKSYSTSVDVSEVVVQCRPSSVALVVGTIWAVALCCAYIPAANIFMHIGSAWVPFSLAGAAGSFSLLSYRFADRSRNLTALFQLLDTSLYAASALSCALLSTAPASYIFGGVFVVMALHWGRGFSFSWLGLLFFTVLPLAVTVGAGADLPLTLIVFMGGVFFVFTSLNTGKTREHAAIRRRREVTIEQLSRALLETQSDAIAELRIEYGVTLHNVKNDLTPVLAYVDLAITDLERGGRPIADLEDAREAIVVASQRVRQQLGELHTQQASQESFRLGDLLGDLGSLHPGCPLRNDALGVGAFPDVRVRGSLDSVRVALRNLVNNAFEAGATRLDMEAALLDGGGRVGLTVSDNGPGIPGHIVDDPFSAFTTHGKKDGTGLGLFICRSLMESLGGEVRLVRTGPEGTSFELTLPLAAGEDGTAANDDP